MREVETNWSAVAQRAIEARLACLPLSEALVKLFQYVVVYHPKDDEEPAQIVVELRTVLAKSKEAAALRAAREIPLEYEEKLDRVEVAVRPF